VEGGGGVGAGGPGILAVGGDRTYLVKLICNFIPG
jgi:hypothetical protein